MSQNQEAPGQLEIIREFLNTWRIPNDTRTPIDQFQTVDDVITFRGKYWDEESSFHTLDELKQFREEIRLAVEEQGTLQKWFEKYSFRVCVTENMDDITYEPIRENNLYTMMLQIILTTINEKQWGRLKACPDCRWVFYDHSRNGSKRWCGMYAGGKEGRACGTIAKVKNYRAKRKGRSGYNG
ncbi:CGNR zinc finger domain-containing protein [Bacillus clarus]|uniref:CGNR zinc finger domain-containing protein n=1 Tax=Bacillus clarus TaxID=2338372 RepID=A0A090YMV9_9BACI|nr:CGNR zinc finger domain-containing protein [Bacillus clarus]KFM99804.1 CGNR zinc finger family protein [Bacillus clarus]RFT65096.1 CGNR zinc finger domain-containing protein [Bacillus clarus]